MKESNNNSEKQLLDQNESDENGINTPAGLEEKNYTARNGSGKQHFSEPRTSRDCGRSKEMFIQLKKEISSLKEERTHSQEKIENKAVERVIKESSQEIIQAATEAVSSNLQINTERFR